MDIFRFVSGGVSGGEFQGVFAFREAFAVEAVGDDGTAVHLKQGILSVDFPAIRLDAAQVVREAEAELFLLVPVGFADRGDGRFLSVLGDCIAAQLPNVGMYPAVVIGSAQP